MTPDRVEHVPLTDDEKRLLMKALNDWFGPAHPTDALARALGFRGVAEMRSDIKILRRSIERGDPLSSLDWGRVLAATEVVFASDVFGSGVDWRTTTGLTDEDSIKIIRGLQRKLVSVYTRP